MRSHARQGTRQGREKAAEYMTVLEKESISVFAGRWSRSCFWVMVCGRCLRLGCVQRGIISCGVLDSDANVVTSGQHGTTGDLSRRADGLLDSLCWLTIVFRLKFY